MSFDDAELLKEFVVESQEHLSDVENQLLTLEFQGDDMDVALVNTVFRAVHSIKGAAGFLGLEVLQSLAHREEEVLNKLRNKELKPTSEVVNTLLKATDRLKSLLDEIDSSNDEDVSDHCQALERILNGEPAGTIQKEELPASESVDQSTGGLTPDAKREFLVECYDNLEQLERDLMVLEKSDSSENIMNSVFRNIHTIKGTSGFLGFVKLENLTHSAENLLGSVRAGQIALDEQISGSLFEMIDMVRNILSEIESSGQEGSVEHDVLVNKLAALLDARTAEQAGDKKKTSRRKSNAKPAKSSPRAKSSKTSAAPPEATVVQNSASIEDASPVAAVVESSQIPLPRMEIAPAVQSSEVLEQKSLSAERASNTDNASNKSNSGESSAADSTIRVDVSLLDKLMTCVGELVLARNQILQYTNGQADSELQATSQRLNLITTELQEGVMKTRMQPIGNVWGKFPRLVRDLAVICDKQVRIEMEGKETELDKTIIEAIKDPLTHLVRNTVDHGIEKADVRVKNGKPAEGCLTLRAYHEGGQVNIEICDDGAGLNLERIRAKAVERGLISQDQVTKLSDRDVGNLIFLPGFSTAEKVSNVSGRGVGMDVVKTNIEKIGGTVDLQTKPGFGTTIKIKIPLTLAIIPALIVTNDGNRYAIPQVNLLELVRLDGEQATANIEWIQGAPVYRLRGRLLPLVYLRKELQIEVSQDPSLLDSLNIVVLRADDRQFGLVVDRINDTEEIVVKPLSKQLKGVPVYSGTTIMGDGKVALILDVLGLAHRAHVISQNRDRALTETTDRTQTRISNSQTLLVLGIGDSHRYAIPLSQVTRLEKIEKSIIETADQQEVVQYRGEILPLIRLANSMGVYGSTENADDHLLEVVVYTENNRSVGLVVDRIVDIVETAIEATQPTQRAGLLGAAVIQNHVTGLLDLPNVIRQSLPQVFE